MSEPTPIYNAGNITTGQVLCQSCGAEIGRYIERDRIICIKIGNVILDDAWGWCECGREWTWHSSSKQIAELVQHVLEMRRNGKKLPLPNGTI